MSETNPIRKFRQARTRGNAIKAKCAECMGCTDYHLERGFRDLIRACSSRDCPLHPFRPYRRDSLVKSVKTTTLDAEVGVS